METDRSAAMERATQNRAMRGMTLNLLYRSKGRPTMIKIVEQAVLGVGGSIPDVEELLYYLESKGYVQRKGPDEHRIPGIGDVVVITAAGIDLVEGTTEDHGVRF